MLINTNLLLRKFNKATIEASWCRVEAPFTLVSGIIYVTVRLICVWGLVTTVALNGCQRWVVFSPLLSVILVLEWYKTT